MSDRDGQKKYERESNVDSTIFSQVNIGENADNKFDAADLTHLAGTTDIPKQIIRSERLSLRWAIIQHALGVAFSVAIAYAGMQVFRDYFYGRGKNEIIPSLLLLIFSLAIGYTLSKTITTKLSTRLRK